MTMAEMWTVPIPFTASGEHSHDWDSLKSVLQSMKNSKDLNSSLLKGEVITLSRFIYKINNSQRRWKLYGLLVKLKKCLERFSETKIHFYAETMLSPWDGALETSFPPTSLPSRQMLEYLCVSLQGCAKLCIYIASLCEQAAIIMVKILQKGMFLSNLLVFLAIVSRVRVLICSFFKSTVGWYDGLIVEQSFLPSTNSQWLHKGTVLPTSLMKWLGAEATSMTIDVRRNASDVSLLERLFNSSIDDSVENEGEVKEVLATTSPLAETTPTVIPDLGEKLSRADLAKFLAKAKVGCTQPSHQASPNKQQQGAKRLKTSEEQSSPPKKRIRTLENRPWCPANDKRSFTHDRRSRPKLKVSRFVSKRSMHQKWNVGYSNSYNKLEDDVFPNGSPKKTNRSRRKIMAGRLKYSVLSSAVGKPGKRKVSVMSQRLGSSSHFRRSLSKESTNSSQSGASQVLERVRKLEQHVAKVRQRRRSRSGTYQENGLVIRNEGASISPGAKQHRVSNQSNSNVTIIKQGLPNTVMPSRSPEKYEVSRIHGSLLEPSEGTSLSGIEHKLSKKKKLVKRLKKLTDKYLGKMRDRSRIPTAPDDSLHYANQMTISQRDPTYSAQHQTCKLPYHGGGNKHHQEGNMGLHYKQGNVQQHHPKSYKQQHHLDNNRQYPQQGRRPLNHKECNTQQKQPDSSEQQHNEHNKQQYHPKGKKRKWHIGLTTHQSQPPVTFQQTLPKIKHALSHQVKKMKGHVSNHPKLPKQGKVSGQVKRHKEVENHTDHEMDSIFASLL